MYRVHGYLNGRLTINFRMKHLPRIGDTVRLAAYKYAEVTEIIWYLDEESEEGQRVDMKMST